MSGSRCSCAADRDDVALDVHADRAGLERRGGQVRLGAAPEHGADAGDQLARGVGLGDVVVGAELEADHLVDLVVLGADHDHRDARGLPDGAAHLGAGDPGQHQVEQHDVGAVAVELGERGVAVGRDRDLEALLAEHVGEGLAVALFVLDDEYPGHFSTSFWMGSAVSSADAPWWGWCWGRVSVNVDPWPSTDHTRMSPPCVAATCLTIERPSPVPPVERCRAGSTR